MIAPQRTWETPMCAPREKSPEYSHRKNQDHGNQIQVLGRGARLVGLDVQQQCHVLRGGK